MLRVFVFSLLAATQPSQRSEFSQPPDPGAQGYLTDKACLPQSFLISDASGERVHSSCVGNPTIGINNHLRSWSPVLALLEN